MQWSALCVLVLAAGCGGAKQTDSGISQFWTDDYKVFDQIYGKTSDKDIYGATLPPSVSQGVVKLKEEASDKKERFVENRPEYDLDHVDPYSYGNRFPSVITSNTLKKLVNKKPIKTSSKFIPLDFKPSIISQETDPETYNYLKHLELLQKQKGQLTNVGGFKPYLTYSGPNPEDTEGFKSIQDILEAHEANKGRNKENDDVDDQVKYLTYGGSKGRSQSKKTKPRPPASKGKPVCVSGRCRKRATNTYRGRTYLTRPILRKIKHKIISY
ncbi:uncharacterized protein LOC126371313 [Pectinophora gossypiella]|uniref:uncharacterized protein LOC126371313 n=1 Tax=Pectinophora gossypiella TaxID=13191 RepID=UPI00214F372C|nr:uncharacterized protein LOC126371313 [Pectinophora gossypiella]